MSLKKLERDFAQADVAAVQGLLAQLSDADVMTRFSLEARLRELRATVAELEAEDAAPTASAALFFGGAPVVGARGIESDFGGSAVSRFQDLVAKVHAHDTVGLGQRGVVPNRALSALHITNIVRGSFGFLLEEMSDQQQLMETPLKAAVDEASRLLEAFSEPDEDTYRVAVSEIDDRVLETAREFFNLMQLRGATLRLVVGDHDTSFGSEDVARAVERARSTTLEDATETINGQLIGVLPEAHQFEFRRYDSSPTIRGRIDKSFTAENLILFNKNMMNVDAFATFNIRRVFKDGDIVKETYTLIGLGRTDRNDEMVPPIAAG